MDNVVKEISQLKITYENGKKNHEAWLKANTDMAGTSDYEQYVNQFKDWEASILGQIKQRQESITRRPIEQVAQLPTQDLDAQLNAMLENISRPKFTAALVEFCKRDLGFFQTMTEIVNRETKGPAANMLSNANVPGLPAIPPAFPQMAFTNQVPMPYFSAPSTSVQNLSAMPPPQVYHHHQPQYTQHTAYGAIPATWTIDEPIKKKKPQPAPERTIKLPFKDFTQT